MSARVHAEAQAAPKSSVSPTRTGLLAGSRGEQLVSQPPLVQAKLTINQPNDRYEQEADRVAEQVLWMPEPRLQRQVEPDEEEEEETLQTKPLAAQITPLVQRQIESEEEEEKEEPIQAKQTSGQTPQVSPVLQNRIHSLRGGGQPLSPSLRNFFEPRFGHDFSRVRVHTDVPKTIHTKLIIGQPNDRYEQEADRVAEQVMRMPEPQVQRRVEPEEIEKPQVQRQVEHNEEWEEALQTFQIAPLIQRQVDPNEEMEEEEEELILTKRTSGQTPQVSSILQTQIHSLRGGGQPLSPFLRNFFEPRFGHDFSRVRIHDDNRTAESARILNAQAYTVGGDVMFGAGRYSPETTEGRRLLAHELTHVTQQVSHVACNPDCSSSGHREGSFFRSGDRLFIWGIWHEDDTHDSFNHRVISRWTRWAYRSASPPLRNRMILYLLNQLPDFPIAITDFSISITPGCNYSIGVSMEIISEFTRAVLQEMQERARTSELEAESQISGEVPSETSLETQPTEQGITTTTTDIEPEETTERHRALGTLESAVEEAERLSQEPITAINEDLSVLESSRLANHYLDVLEHYTNRSISTEDRTAAEDGLSREETIEIIGGNPLRRTLSALYTQGYCEFQAAGGSELEHFFRLEETIAEQFVRGNPTATHNQLRIGFGVPEDTILGIVHRYILYYDNNGIPLPAFGGAGMRDSGYIGSERLEEFEINIANIEDLGLRLLLNALRQTISDPTLMTVEAAQIYFNNVEQVNYEVQNGLSEEIRQRFEETLPFFIGFLAGHGLSTFLMRVPNPTVAGVGLALKGLLTAVGYIMSIDLAGQALSMLHDAAYHLSRVEQNEQGELTHLSERHLNAAAVPIRRMVAEVALSVTTLALTRALRGRATIECTRCRIRRERPLREEEPGMAAWRESLHTRPPRRMTERTRIPPEQEPATPRELRPTLLQEQARRAGTQDFIEGNIEVFTHGTTQRVAAQLIETQGVSLSSTGGRHGGRFHTTTSIEGAEGWALRAPSRAHGEPIGIVGIALPRSVVRRLRTERLMTIESTDRGPQTVFERGAIETLMNEGYFFYVH